MPSDNSIIQSVDILIRETYAVSEPGAAVILVHDGKIVFRKGQGVANLELLVPIDPTMVFRLGSITKQFTAVAILMLAEEGRLALHDPLSKHLPDYPTYGLPITIDHLLTHTSGIRSYTNLPDWPSLWGREFSVDELIAYFKDQPMQFDPGTQWVYNNSGYVLLGAIIEKVSGHTYEQFIQQRIFAPLRMHHSFYDNATRILPGRVAGYERGPEGFMNARHISMTQPYSAGALASTIDDMVLWDLSLYTGQLLSEESLQRAFTPYQLADGTSTDYGYGWRISHYEGHRLMEHEGHINGFKSHVIRMPEDRIFAAVLSNNGGVDPEDLTFRIAALAIGKPYREPAFIELGRGMLARYEGLYHINSKEKVHIFYENNRLFSQHGQGPRAELVPFSLTDFFLKHAPCIHICFIVDSAGVVTGVEMRGRSGIPQFARKDFVTPQMRNQ